MDEACDILDIRNREIKQLKNGLELGNELYAEMQQTIKALDKKANAFMQKCDEQNVEIERIEAELETYRWIPVSERLPEKKGDCLIITTDRPNLRIRYYYDDIGWGIKSITHWMPIHLPNEDS